MINRVSIVFQTSEYDLGLSVEEVFGSEEAADKFCERMCEENPDSKYRVEPYLVK